MCSYQDHSSTFVSTIQTFSSFPGMWRDCLIKVLTLICELAFVCHTHCLEINLKDFIVKRKRKRFNCLLNHRLYIREQMM